MKRGTKMHSAWRGPARILLAMVIVGGVWHFVFAQNPKGRRQTVRQPIAFNHKQHDQAGIKCDACHTRADSSEQAGLPSVSTCAGCHRSLNSSAALTKKLHEYEVSGREISWARVYDLPDFVFFSHEAHLRTKVECRTCHGPVASRIVLWKETDISMKACVACHKQKQASTACNYCHELNR